MKLAFLPWKKLLLQPQGRATSFPPRCQSRASISLLILGEKKSPFHLGHPKLRLFLHKPRLEKPQGLCSPEQALPGRHHHHVKSTGASNRAQPGQLWVGAKLHLLSFGEDSGTTGHGGTWGRGCAGLGCRANSAGVFMASCCMALTRAISFPPQCAQSFEI